MQSLFTPRKNHMSSSSLLFHRCLSVLAQQECVAPGYHLSGAATRISSSSLDRKCRVVNDGDRFCTWKPKGSVFLSLSKEDCGSTVVHVFESGTSFYASPAARLPKCIPSGVTLLGQYVEDFDSETETVFPRVLVFDVLQSDGRPLDGVPVPMRYNTLRGYFEAAAATGNTEESIVQLQWVGQYSSVGVITSGAMKLPHEVESIIVLTDKDVGVFILSWIS